MVITLAILSVVFVVVILLYLIGKKVKEREKLIEKAFEKADFQKKLEALKQKHNRQSTPKVPSIKNK